jgi:hypothetical protein
MANTFGTDILIQAQDPKSATAFCVEQLAFTITDDNPNIIELRGNHINLTSSVAVPDVEEAKQ